MAKIIVRCAFAYDVDAVSQETGLLCRDETLANQADKEDCDINTLVRRFGLTGQLPVDLRVPIEGDFAGVTDFKSAMDLIRDSEAAFMEMPWDVRKRFNHNPGEFVAFCSDKANLDEMRELGIAVPAAEPEPEAAPVRVQVVPDAVVKAS